MDREVKLSRFEFAFLFLSALLTITLVSTSSPLYPFNVWDDTNVFLTLGRGILKGMVPYRDLYDQKGPLLFFLHAFAAFISFDSFTGAWILEVCASFLFAVISWKTVKLYYDVPQVYIWFVPLYLVSIYTIRMFNFGGSAEELCFPLISVCFYTGLKMIRYDRLPSSGESLLCGIMTGTLLWIKYTFLGSIIGLCLFIVIFAISKKQIKELIKPILMFLLGVVIITIPFLIYFAVNNSLEYLWEGYFYNNIFRYLKDENNYGLLSVPVLGKLLIPLVIIVKLSIDYPAYGVLILMALIGVILFDKKYRRGVILLSLLTFVPATLTIFTRVSYIYYYGYILCFYFVLALMMTIKIVRILQNKVSLREKVFRCCMATGVIIFYSVFVLNCKNLYLLGLTKQDLVQYKFAEIINNTDDPKVLTYDVMDSGFFTAAGILPSNRFYCYLNISEVWNEIPNEQNKLIDEGYFDYIVTYKDEYSWDNYEVIAVEEMPYCDFTGILALDRYYLYQKIS